MILHTFTDSSTLEKLSSLDIIKIPIWKGNRIIDTNHVETIKKAVGNNVKSLDKTVFRIVSYNEIDVSGNSIEQKYIIDGQHRVSIIKSFYEDTLCEPAFPVIVIITKVESESDAIELFNQLNNVKPQEWKSDPNLLVNKYILVIEQKFNSGKKKNELLIRSDITRRPYLSSIKLRNELLKYVKYLHQSDENIKQFINKVVLYNGRKIKEFELRLLSEKNTKLIEECITKKFCLAYDLNWVQECL